MTAESTTPLTQQAQQIRRDIVILKKEIPPHLKVIKQLSMTIQLIDTMSLLLIAMAEELEGSND